MSDPILIETFAKEEPFENMGGCRPFGLALKEWIDELPAPIHGVVVEDTSYLPGTPPVGFVHTEDSANYKESMKVGPGGPEWNTEFTCFYPGDSIKRRQNLATAARHGLVIEVADNMDRNRRVGTVENPCELTYEYATGGAGSSLNGYNLKFTWKSDAPAPWIDNDYVPSDFDAHLAEEATTSNSD